MVDENVSKIPKQMPSDEQEQVTPNNTSESSTESSTELSTEGSTKTKKFICEVCGKPFDTKKKLI